jgi:type IV pilus assembly protein PilB
VPSFFTTPLIARTTDVESAFTGGSERLRTGHWWGGGRTLKIPVTTRYGSNRQDGDGTYEIDGIKQVQIDPKAGVTFSSALRALLRADPDVMLVGEVRDQETARLAIDAALTGHLVLTSLHSNSAAATPARLVKIGVEPFLVISAVQCIVAQRLARRLCDRCKEPATVRHEVLTKLGWNDDWPIDGATFFKPGGCAVCGDSGYHGRFALHEVMPMTEGVGDAIADLAPTAVIEASP